MTEADPTRWFAERVLPHEPSLRRYLKRFCSEPSEIDDLIQDTYIRVMALPESERQDIRSPQRFLFRAARNLAYDRSRQLPTVPIDPLIEAPHPELTDQTLPIQACLELRETVEQLVQAIDMLPGVCREVMLLRRLDGLSQKEIAARLGLSENTVEKYVSKGTRHCAQYLRELEEREYGHR